MQDHAFQKLTEPPLLLDGATGSNLLAAQIPRGVSSEQWVLAHPEVLQSLQRAYVETGSQVVYAPTFGNNRRLMASLGVSEDAAAFNLALVLISLAKKRQKYPRTTPTPALWSCTRSRSPPWWMRRGRCAVCPSSAP